MAFKVTHKTVTLDLIEQIMKTGTRATQIIENPLWEGAYIFHTYIDKNNRTLHMFFHDPINGHALVEGQDILSVPITGTTFKMEDKK